MAVVLHNINATAEAGKYHLDVSVDEVRSTFNAAVSADGFDSGCDEALVFLLSERGLAEKGNSAQYHADLCLLLFDVQRGRAVKLPFVFGTHRRFPTGSTYARRPWWHRMAFWRRPAKT